MYYIPYEQKILKIARIRDTIYKFRFLIIGILSLIIATVVALLSVKGSITRDVVIQPQYVYGETLTPKGGKAFMAKVHYEYSDGVGWSKEKPVMPGEYAVRAASKNGFGAAQYGAEKKFSITQKELEIAYKTTTLTYGEMPTLAFSGLVEGDTLALDEVRFTFNDYLSENVQTVLEKDSFKIVNAQSEDVTRAYLTGEDIFKATDITLLPRVLTFATEGGEKVYDGMPLTVDSYRLESGETVFGDTLSVKCSGSQTKYGSSKNGLSVAFKDKDGRDISKWYKVEVAEGTLSVTKRPITLTVATLAESKVYDGKNYGKISWKLTDGTLANGENFSADCKASAYNNGQLSVAKNAGMYALKMSSLEIENDSERTTDNYEITIIDGSLTVKKRPVTVVVESLENKVYDGYPHGEIVWRVSEETPLVNGQTVGEESKACARLNGEISIGRNVGEYALGMEKFVVFSGEENTTGNYQLTVKTGSYQVTPRQLSFSVWNEGKIGAVEYDGLEYAPVWSQTGGKLAFGDSLSVTAYAKKDGEIVSRVRDFGEYVYALDVTATWDEANEDATGNYEIVVDGGEISISKRVVILALWTGWARTIEYNGKSYGGAMDFVEGTSIVHGEIFDASASRILAHDEDGNLVALPRDVGVYTYTMNPLVCVDGNEADITTHNYEFRYVDNKLTITPRIINLTVKTVENRDSIVYDGYQHYLDLELDKELAENETWSKDSNPVAIKGGVKFESIRNAGEYLLTMNECKVFRMDSNKADDETTGNYIITVNEGAFKVEKRAVSVSAVSNANGTFVYDGITYAAERTDTGLADGERWTDSSAIVIYKDGMKTERIRDVGEYRITMLERAVCREDDEEDITTDNYVVTFSEHTAKITPKEIVLKCVAVGEYERVLVSEMTYDGKEYAVAFVVVTGGGCVDGEKWLDDMRPFATKGGETFYSVRNVGEYVFRIQNVGVCREENEEDVTTGNYDIEVMENGLDIGKKDLTIRFESGSNLYDGEERFVAYTIDGYVGGEGLSAESKLVIRADGAETARILNAASYTYTFEPLIVCKNDNPTDVTTDNYEVDLLSGTWDISKRTLEVSITAKDKVYDAYPYHSSNLEIDIVGGDGLVVDEEYYPILVSPGRGIIDAGEYAWEESFRISGHRVQRNNVAVELQDSTMNYAISVVSVPDKVTIHQRSVTLELVDKEKPYDGQPLVSNQCRYSDDSEYKLVEGHTIALQTSGNITVPSKVVNRVEEYEIYHGTTVINKENYKLDIKDGQLSVFKRAVTVAPLSAKSTYNGLEFEYFQFDGVPSVYVYWTDEANAIYGKAMFDGLVVDGNVAWNSGMVNAGVYKNALWTVNGSVRFTYNGTDVTEYFDIENSASDVVITPRKIHIVTDSIEREYDGTALVGRLEDVRISSGSLLDGDKLSGIELYGEAREIGDVAVNGFETVQILDKDGIVQGFAHFNENGECIDGNVGGNYEISVTFGVLSVVKSEVIEDKAEEQTPLP